MLARKVKIANERRFKRLKAVYLLGLEEQGTGEKPCFANTRDISASGLRAVVPRPFREGKILKVSVVFAPLGRVLDTLGRVMRVRRLKHFPSLYVVGIRFLELPERDRRELDAFVEFVAGLPKAGPRIDHGEMVSRKARSASVAS